MKIQQLQCGDRVDRIQFAYGGKWGTAHGGGGGSPKSKAVPRSGIVRIDVRSGAKVDQLKFVFGDNSSLTCGKTGGDTFGQAKYQGQN